MRLRFIWFFIGLGLPSIQSNDEHAIQENFRDLLHSINENNAKKVDMYRNILGRDAAREKQIFDAVKGDWWSIRERKVGKLPSLPLKSDAGEKNAAFTREVGEPVRRQRMANPSTGFVRITPDPPGPSTPWDHLTIKPRETIFEAAAWNDPAAMKRLVEEEGHPANATNALNQTAGHILISRFNCREALECLLRKDPSIVSMKDKWGQTILHVAIMRGYTALMEFLVETWNSSIYEPLDSRFGNTAIHLAAEERRLPILIYLVEMRKGDVNVRNALGEPPIFSAAAYNHVNVVEFLMDHGADATLVNKNDENILFMSARNGHIDVARFLLDDVKVPLDIDWRNNQGETILHTAVKYERLDFIKYVVEKKKIDKDIFDNLDRTALYIATEMGNLTMVRYLVEHGANYNLNDLDGRIPAEIATDKRVKEYLSGLKDQKKRSR